MDNKDLEKAAKEYAKQYLFTAEPTKDLTDHFIAGAQWMELQIENNRLTTCERMTEEEAEREQEFAVNFIRENHRQPTYSDCIEMTRQQVISKACEWIKENGDHYIGHYLNDDDTYIDDSFFIDFRKSMEE